MRPFSFLFSLLIPLSFFAASGGPDTYGYTWKDSNEPGGPVYNWIDITATGQLVTGLADDNVVGPLVMTTNFPYYWYGPKKLWIGSNGYVAFENTNIASPFPLIPMNGGGNDYIAAFMADLNFSGPGNPGECWVLDSAFRTIISYINVPFWSSTAPSGWDGSNTFQIILDRNDSTVTVQYQSIIGTTLNNDITIGIESVTGDIGLMHSNDTLPPSNFAIRYYNPSMPLLQVTDATCNWLTDDRNHGHMRALGGGPFEMVINARNTGNQDLAGFEVVGTVQNNAFVQQVSDTQVVSLLQPSTDTTVVFGDTFNATVWGTYRYIGRVRNVVNELVLTNNIIEQEVIVYDTTFPTLNVNWAGISDDGIGLGWNGGNGGIGVFIDVPMHPAYIEATTVRIATNGGTGMHMKVYDDDGPNDSKGTLLDSVFVSGANATPGDHVIPLSSPLVLNDGGLFVEWQMDAAGINIARDIVSPFSRNTYEVLGGVWAEYRDRETEDFHLGLRISQLPVTDGGCTQFFGILNGSTIGQPTPVRTWVRNFGNQVLSGFDVHYQFDSQAVVTQAFAGVLNPGDSSLFIFNQLIDPIIDATGDLCTWTSISGDSDALNDTTCINISIATGIGEVLGNGWAIGPNPSQGEVFVTVPNDQRWSYVVYNVQGLLLITAKDVSGSELIDLNGQAAGQYLLEIHSGDAIHRERLVLNR